MARAPSEASLSAVGLSMTSRGLHPAPALRFASSHRDPERDTRQRLATCAYSPHMVCRRCALAAAQGWGILDVCETGGRWSSVGPRSLQGKGLPRALGRCAWPRVACALRRQCLTPVSVVVMQTAPAIVPYLQRYHEQNWTAQHDDDEATT